MINGYLEGYVTGAVESASDYIEGMRFSSLTAVCFDRSEDDSLMMDYLGLEGDDRILEKTGDSLELALKEVLHCEDDGGVGRLAGRLQAALGKCIGTFRFANIDEVRDEVSGYSGFDEFFYIVENLLVARFEDVSVLIVRGNDE